MPKKVTLYDMAGDEPQAIERYAVVAREIVATDPKRFAYELPAKAVPAAPMAKSPKT